MKLNKTFVVAEIGSNHNNSLNSAKKIIDEEVKKCELKCASCHKKETDQRRDLLLY